MKPNVVLYGTSRFNQTLLTNLLTNDLPMSLAIMDSAAGDEQIYEPALVAARGCVNLSISMAQTTDLVTADALIIGDVAVPDPGAEQDEVLAANIPPMRGLIREAMAQGFTGKIVVASQYDDILTYFAQKYSGVGVNNCIGIGTLAHTTLLRNTLAHTFNVPQTSLQAYVIGVARDHLVAWSRSTVGPAPILALMANEDVDFDASQLGEIEQGLNAATVSTNDILRAKAVTRVLRALFYDRPMIGVVTNLLLSDDDRVMPLSTPVRLNGAGVSKLVAVSYTELEQRQLDEITAREREIIVSIENGGLEAESDDEDEPEH